MSEQPYSGPADPRVAALRLAEFAFPGPLRDQLVDAVLSGAKTSTAGLVTLYEAEDEPVPRAGDRNAVVDSAGRIVAVTETTEVRIVRLDEVDLRHALDEGEGYTTVAEWRAGHERFWHSDELCQVLGDPDFTVEDDTRVVLERFRLLADFR
ncbi:ASCH domain-containing protein [Kitasatospora purpeofusca]|uniref:ASCH domain-containing protein n=1 Tax=Kitasatospora purpeofusca TaxID=67352 RepID=UPI002A5B0A70|nr:ASCH domain-containing protein [Kitasatospora purpeofusca]MDY0815209.1 ASCH domain-containing protein [Kitasatospora purpeofusca]